jgi:lipopolysaccharide/colanic/teichoic acid biosynthesis glycosyltransferase
VTTTVELRAERIPTVAADTALRRAVDVVAAVAGLLLGAPLLLAIAIAVRLSSRGPVIYRQERVGRDGVTFRICKFRTMVAGADRAGSLVSGEADPRVTRVGRRLRRSRLDELPQLLNLLRGDVTLVGPRPEVARYVAHYTPAERKLLCVRPGIVGPGALLFAQGQAAELDGQADPERFYLQHQMHPRLELDLDYLAHRGFWRDLTLLARAGGVVVESC